MVGVMWMFFGVLFSVVSFFPLVNSKHWVFRIFDFIRIQLSVVLFFLLVAIFFSVKISATEVFVILIIIVSIVYQLSIIVPYFPKGKKNYKEPQDSITAICINVKQENEDYKRLVAVIEDMQPDILLTMETNKQWEQNLNKIEENFKNVIRVPKENRYGMHFYTKLDMKDYKIHYLISKEHPSIEIKLTDSNKDDFIFWGIHPPPPSPTEKTTSKQKDAELMKVAKIVRKTRLPAIVSGDFNNVAWSNTSKLFSKISNLKDARINRGIYSTFPANLRLLGFPIDLIFHSNTVNINKIKVLPSIGSDHLPIKFTFSFNNKISLQKELNEELENLANQKIVEGKEAAIHEN